MTVPHELSILKAARKLKFTLDGAFSIAKPRYKWSYVSLTLLYHSSQILSEALLVTDIANNFVLTPATLARHIHCVLMPTGYIFLGILSHKRNLLIETAQDVNEILLNDQIPLSGPLRSAIISELETRHRLIIFSVTLISQFMVLIYVLPPLVAFLLDPSPARKLDLPLGMPDPLPLFGFTPNNVTRAIVYVILSGGAMAVFYIVYFAKALIIVSVDALKTAFFICGLSLETLGRDEDFDWGQFESAVKFHQRLFRISSKVKSLCEPILSASMTGSISFDVVSALAVSQELNAQNIKMVFGTFTTIVIVCVFFILPASVSHMAGDVAERIYFNENWVAQKHAFTRYFPFMIMRSHNLVRFRLYNCWVLSSENLVKYLQLLYSFYLVIKSATSSSTRATEVSL